MKKTARMALILVAILMVTFLASCGKFKCDICGKEKSGTKHTSKVAGEEIAICDDCYKEMNGLIGG